MTTELRFLAASIILGLLQLIAASHLISFQYGYRWTASDRDEPVPPLRGLANRIDQGDNKFSGNIPFLRRVGPDCASDKHPQRAHDIGRASIFLGTAWLCARGSGWFWATALHDFLEYGVGRYLLIPHYVVQLV